MHRGSWWTTVHGIAKSWTQLSDEHFSTGEGIMFYPLLKCVIRLSVKECYFIDLKNNLKRGSTVLYQTLIKLIHKNHFQHMLSPVCSTKHMHSNLSKSEQRKIQQKYQVYHFEDTFLKLSSPHCNQTPFLQLTGGSCIIELECTRYCSPQ